MPIEKRWVVKPQGDSEAVAKLAAVLRISPVLANLLVQRGIDTVEKADKFFKPSLADLHDPFLMKDMDKAVERVEQAVRNNEKIMVYGDYDVDGCTAVALVYKFLRQIGHKNLMFYIPDRYTEGYGISVKGIDLAARKGVTYQRIELWVGQQRHEPVRAQLYVQSDKLAKQAHFEMDATHATVSAMVLIDQLGNQRQTRIRYLGRKERTVPSEWLNPMFLSRSPVLE